MSSSSLSDRISLALPLAAVALALALAGCGGDGDSEAEGDAVPYEVGEMISDSTVALIFSSAYGTDTISAQRYGQQLQMAMQQRSPSQRTPDQMQTMHRQMVRGFARQYVMRGEADSRGMSADTAQVTQRLEQLKQRYQSEEQFRSQLQRNNVTIDSLRRILASQLQQQSLQQEMMQNYDQPTAEEVETYSKENRRIRAQHILIRAGQDAPQSVVDSARQAAQALVDSARMENVNFADLARRNSEGPSAQRGGDLGFFSRNQMVEEFSDAAYALSDSGDVAPEPVRTQYGFHVIRLTDPGEPMDTTKARQQMTQERQKQAVEDQVNSLLEEVTVRVNPNIVEAGLGGN